MNITSLEFRLPAGTACVKGTCASCGCRDDRACPEGCAWIDASHLLCTACLDLAIDAVDLRIGTEVARTSDAGGDFVALVLTLKQPKPTRRRRPGKKRP